jgi:hypothetical protein
MTEVSRTFVSSVILTCTRCDCSRRRTAKVTVAVNGGAIIERPFTINCEECGHREMEHNTQLHEVRVN